VTGGPKKNLAHNNAVSVRLESGDDAVILKGNAVEIAHKPMLTKLDKAYRAKYKTPLLIDPESVVYHVRPQVAWAWTEKNYLNDATRWEFKASRFGNVGSYRGSRCHTFIHPALK
jgi:hypothetical protein